MKENTVINLCLYAAVIIITAAYWLRFIIIKIKKKKENNIKNEMEKLKAENEDLKNVIFNLSKQGGLQNESDERANSESTTN